MDMIKCPYCQQEIPAGSKFCPECGKSLLDTSPAPVPLATETYTSSLTDVSSQSAPVEIEQKAIPAKKGRALKIAIPLLIVVLIAGFIGGKYAYDVYHGSAAQEQSNVAVCSVDDCPFPVARGSEYCNSHTCMWDGCSARRLSGSSCCETHTCHESGCHNRATGKYCAVHTCLEPSCYNQASEGGFCSKHYDNLQKAIADALLDDVQAALEQVNKDLTFTDMKAEWYPYSSLVTISGTITNNGSKIYSYVKVQFDFLNSAGSVIDSQWTFAVGTEGIVPGASKKFELLVPRSTYESASNVSYNIIDWM